MPRTQRALTYGRPGPLAGLEETPWPAPHAHSKGIVVKVEAIGINPIDYRLPQFTPTPLWGRRLIGCDFSGEVLEVGRRVSHVSPGDRVYGMVSPLAGGVSADAIHVPGRCVARAPTTCTHQDAASVPLAALTALQSLRNLGKLKPGQNVLINGASGGVGVFAVQIARHLGAKVMAVCSESNHPLVSNLGAQEVMDYTHKDFTQQDRHFDLVFDARGNRTAGECERILEPGGRFVTTEVTLTRTLSAVLNPLRGKSRHAVMVRSNRDDLTLLAQWVEDGVLRPVVERVYPRATMLEALKHLRSKRAKGKLVIDW